MPAAQALDDRNPTMTMDDSNRILEQKALRNVRTLFERLEGDERDYARRQKIWLLFIAVPVALIVAALGASVLLSSPKSVDRVAQSCELDVWNARAAAFERNARQSDPGATSRVIQNRLKLEQPALMEQAKLECASRSR
jgi:flagellar basal body-associated protein FliL